VTLQINNLKKDDLGHPFLLADGDKVTENDGLKMTYFCYAGFSYA